MLLQRAISFFRGSPASGGEDPPRKPNKDGLPTTYAEAGAGYAGRPSPANQEEVDEGKKNASSELHKSSVPSAAPFPPIPPWHSGSEPAPPPKGKWVRGPTGWQPATDDQTEPQSSASTGHGAEGQAHPPKAAAAPHLDLRYCWSCGQLGYLRKDACVNTECASWLQ